MVRFFVRRTLWAVFLCFVVTVLVFLIFFTIPFNPAQMILPEQRPTPQRIAWAEHELGLDRPIYVQYAKFMWRLFHLDLGNSYVSRPGEEVKVTTVIRNAAPRTASLVLGGLFLCLVVAFPLALWAALRPRGLLDRAGTVFVLIGISAPPFVVALLLRQWVVLEWQWFPVGYCPLFPPEDFPCGGVVDWAHRLVLPWFAFGLLYVALYMRMLRANVVEALGDDYVRTARAKGAGQLRVLRVHVLRNSLLAIVTMLGLDFAVAIGNAIYIEPALGVGGLGSVAFGALRSGFGYDLPTILGVTLAVSFAVILLNLVVDLLYAVLDPRIRVA